MPNNNRQLSIAVFLPSLEKGGAERRMTLLAMTLKKQGYKIDVIVLRKQGAFVKSLMNAGVEIRSINKRGRLDLIFSALRTKKLFAQQQYDVVLSCLPSANTFSILCKLSKTKPILVWGLAAADMPMSEYSLWARLGASVQKWASRFADKIIVNSNKGLVVALQQGFAEQKLELIHNGVDTKQFVFNRSLGQKWQEQLNVPEQSPVIGIVARLDPAKGLETFLQAAELAYEQDWYFMIFASGTSQYARQLKIQIQSHPLFGKRLFLLENIQVDSSVYNAFDITTISSVSESFPNVMLESMACGVPVVATDVGDCEQVLQQFGKIVPIKDPVAMYNAWQSQFNHELSFVGAEVMHEYIVSEYSIKQMIRQFKSVLFDMHKKSNPAQD